MAERVLDLLLARCRVTRCVVAAALWLPMWISDWVRDVHGAQGFCASIRTAWRLTPEQVRRG